MLRKIREAQEEEGFTLIELLVVVIIIGILAAIAIPVFLNQRKKAWDSAAKSDLRNAATVQETYFTDWSSYAAATGTLEGAGYDFQASTAVVTTVIDGDSDYYCMKTKHDSSTNTWYMSSSTGAPSTTACVAD